MNESVTRGGVAGGAARGAERARLRVLFLTAHPGISGPLPKLAPLMVDGLRRLGCEVATTPWSHRPGGESTAAKVLCRAADLLAVRRLLAARPVDVMLVTTTHDWPALLRDVPLLLFTRGRCKARVLQLHGSMVDRLLRPGNTLMKLCSRWLVRQCDAVLVLSEEERREWSRFSPETRFEVVVNPFVPPAQVASACREGRPPALLFAGRLIAAKGVFDLLEAMRLVRTEEPCLLRIAGKGPEEDAVRRRVSEYGLDDCVDLVGYAKGEALEELYESAALFVLPTYFGEGFPTVISEAMAAGLPVVTTPIRGAADLLTEGENALFVPPHRPRELAAAVLRLVRDPSLAAEMGRRNREKVREFAPEAVVPRYVEIMRSLVR